MKSMAHTTQHLFSTITTGQGSFCRVAVAEWVPEDTAAKCAINSRCSPSGVNLGDRALLLWLRVLSKGTQNIRIQECKCAINSRCLPSGVNLGDRALLPWLRAMNEGHKTDAFRNASVR
jgi:hypothetical protein